jgi:hypothetical protein
VFSSSSFPLTDMVSVALSGLPGQEFTNELLGYFSVNVVALHQKMAFTSLYSILV